MMEEYIVTLNRTGDVVRLVHIHRHSYLVDLIGSRRTQVFMRKGEKELCHILIDYVQMIECVHVAL